MDEMPNCFFDKIDPEHKRKGTKTKDYAEVYFNNVRTTPARVKVLINVIYWKI